MPNCVLSTTACTPSAQLNPLHSGQLASTIVIFLGTYQGEAYLAEQLDSFSKQSYRNWSVWASDDGSSDSTQRILSQYHDQWHAERLTIHAGPAHGFAANFMYMVCHADVDADFYAFSDQDDIWDADKLARAASWLNTVPNHTPALFCSRTRLIDANNKEIGLSPLFQKPPSFANALMQNIGGGNTMVFNRAARDLLKKAGDGIKVASHDWWLYIAVTACGGQVFYDTQPSLRYRQHASNAIGCNASWQARIKRMRMLWQGRFKQWNDIHIQALHMLQESLSAEAQRTLHYFEQARQMSLAPRLINLERSGIHRQTALGNLGLLAAAIFRKL